MQQNTQINTGMVLDSINNENTEKLETLKEAVQNKRDLANKVSFKKVKTQVREYRKIGRNEKCPCGSGKKYKNCCLSSNKYEHLVDFDKKPL